MNKTLAVTRAATPAALHRFLPASAADSGPQRVAEVPTLPGAGHRFGGGELSFQLGGARPWRAACAVAPAGDTGRFAVSEKAGLLAYTHAPNLVRLLDARTGSTLCDLTAPDPQRVLDLALDTAGDTLVALAPSGLVQVWDLTQLLLHRLPIPRPGIDWRKRLACPPHRERGAPSARHRRSLATRIRSPCLPARIAGFTDWRFPSEAKEARTQSRVRKNR